MDLQRRSEHFGRSVWPAGLGCVCSGPASFTVSRSPRMVAIQRPSERQRGVRPLLGYPPIRLHVRVRLCYRVRAGYRVPGSGCCRGWWVAANCARNPGGTSQSVTPRRAIASSRPPTRKLAALTIGAVRTSTPCYDYPAQLARTFDAGKPGTPVATQFRLVGTPPTI